MPQSNAISKQEITGRFQAPEVSSIRGDSRLFVRFMIRENNFQGLLDPGAHLSALGSSKHKYFEKLRFSVTRETSMVFLADLSEIEVLGTMTLPVTCNGTTNDIKFLVCPAIHHKLLCGMDVADTFGLVDIFRFRDVVSRGSFLKSVDMPAEFCEIRVLVPKDGLDSGQLAN